MRFNRFLLAVVFVASQLVIPPIANASSEKITVQIKFGSLCVSTNQFERSKVVLAICSTNDNRQLFQIEKSGPVTALTNGNFCISSPEYKNGTDLQNIGCSVGYPAGYSGMWWRNGSRLLVKNNRNIDFCFDIEDGAARTGAVAQIWECVDSASGSIPAQTFSLVQVTPPNTLPPRTTVPPRTTAPPPITFITQTEYGPKVDACIANSYNPKPKQELLQGFCALIATYKNVQMQELLFADLVRTNVNPQHRYLIDRCLLDAGELDNAKGAYIYRRIQEYNTDLQITEMAAFADVVSQLGIAKTVYSWQKKINTKTLKTEYGKDKRLGVNLSKAFFMGAKAFKKAVDLGKVLGTYVRDVKNSSNIINVFAVPCQS